MKITDLVDNKRAESEVTAQTEVALKIFQRILKSKGYTRTKARTVSAMFEWTFEQGARRIVLSGWHGTGTRGTSRWYGDLKAVLSLFDNIKNPNTKWKSDKMFDLDTIDGTVQDHTTMLSSIQDYLQRYA